jgi:hypothetical protein
MSASHRKAISATTRHMSAGPSGEIEIFDAFAEHSSNGAA